MATVKHCHHFHHLHLYTFKGEGGQKKCTVCTLVKMMIIMDDPLVNDVNTLSRWSYLDIQIVISSK